MKLRLPPRNDENSIALFRVLCGLFLGGDQGARPSGASAGIACTAVGTGAKLRGRGGSAIDPSELPPVHSPLRRAHAFA